MKAVDLNADVGESFGAWTMGEDDAVLASVTSANVACGLHAGDPGVMRRTVRLARRAGVAVGAHPGLQDLAGFGRREMPVSPGEVQDLVLYQIGALAAIARAEGVRLEHVKPHGALYNMAARDPALADAVAAAVRAADDGLVLVGLAGSMILRAGRDAGLRVASEVFADRAYEPDGSLVSRAKEGSVIHDPAAVVQRAIAMVRDGEATAIDGSRVRLQADTICVHGDTAGAGNLARRLRRALEEAGVLVRPLAAR